MEKSITLQEMLDARERRAMRQQTMRNRHGCAMICFTMNIAGPIKNSSLIRRGFDLGCRRVDGQLARLKQTARHRELFSEDTGCEGYWLVPMDALELKRTCAEIEDITPLGRLFDLDVLTADGEKLDRTALGLPPRRCLICGANAKECARSRTHTVEQLQQRTRELLREATRADACEAGAGLACRALLYEVGTTPKPGLVDCRNNGSHRDMDRFTFFDSVTALRPYFAHCVAVGLDTADQPAANTFAALGAVGRMAEGTMLQATGGVNTHKGAVFSLGLVCAALGRLPRSQWHHANLVLAEAGALVKGLTAQAFCDLNERTPLTVGQKLYLEYGILGVRGQAENGFPAVRCAGLPALERGLALGYSLNRAGCAALLHILACTDDTNMIARSDRATQLAIKDELTEIIGRTPYPEETVLRALDDRFIEKNLSPGGSADLLALCYLMHFLKEEEPDGR